MGSKAELADRIQSDMKAALLGGDRFVGETLRGLKAAILNEEVALNKREGGLSDEEIEKIVSKEVKKRKESRAIYEQNGRPELAETEQKEADILAVYLPTQLNESEIRTLAEEVIVATGAAGPSAMGQVIGGVKAKAGNTADGALVARIVKELLNS